MTTPNLPGNLTTESILANHAAYKARKKAAARKLAAQARKSERQAQIDAYAASESLKGYQA